jgi:hypothetical protein
VINEDASKTGIASFKADSNSMATGADTRHTEVLATANTYPKTWQTIREPGLNIYYWILFSLFSALVLMSIFEYLRFNRQIPDDSPAFQEALQFWKSLLAQRFDTPRRLKRFLNHLRFNAMRIRTNEGADRSLSEELWTRYVRGVKEESREGLMQGEESALVMLSILEACCGDNMQAKSKLVSHHENQMPPPRKSFESGWEELIEVDDRLKIELGTVWANRIKDLLIEQLRTFEMNDMPQPTETQLNQFELRIADRS